MIRVSVNIKYTVWANRTFC